MVSYTLLKVKNNEIFTNQIVRYSFLEKHVPTLTAFEKNGLKLIFSLEKLSESNMISINVIATNSTSSNMTEFLFQAAVPKVIELFSIS